MALGFIFTPRGPIIIPTTGGGPFCWNTEEGCSAIQVGMGLFLIGIAIIALISIAIVVYKDSKK